MKLSADEIRLIVVVVLALTVGSSVKYYRDRLPHEPTPPPKSETAGATPTRKR